MVALMRLSQSPEFSHNMYICCSLTQVKLEITTGGCAGTMELDLYSGDTLLGRLTNGSLLGSYPIEDGMRLHVIDQFTQIAAEAGDVQKFEISDQQYNTKQNTVRDFLRRNKLGKYNAEEQAKMAERAAEDQAERDRAAALCVIGSRCLVTAKGPRRVGTIRYNGEFEEKPGAVFIGVEFDEPLGVNDGSVNGRRYFECRPKYGSMVPLAAVTVGDYPVEEFDLDEEI